MHALLLVRPDDFQSVKVSELWARLKGCPFSDATFHVRKSWGLLADDLSPDEAARYFDAFNAQGFEVKVCPASSLRPPAPTQAVKSLGFSTEAMALTVDKIESAHAWNDLSGLFAFALHESVSKTTKVTEGPSSSEKIIKMGLSLATGIPLPIAKKKTVIKTVRQDELVFFLDLIFGNPVRRFRIDAQHLDYGFLGPEKEMSGQGNFRLMFETMRTRAPKAFLNRGSRILVAHQPISTMGYDTVHDVERETKWFLSLKEI